MAPDTRQYLVSGVAMQQAAHTLFQAVTVRMPLSGNNFGPGSLG